MLLLLAMLSSIDERLLDEQLLSERLLDETLFDGTLFDGALFDGTLLEVVEKKGHRNIAHSNDGRESGGSKS